MKEETFFSDDDESRMHLSEVLSVGEREETAYGDSTTYFKARIIKGELKGKEVEAQQILDAYLSVNSRVLKQGDHIYLYRHDEEGKDIWYADQYDRISGLSVLAFLFVLFVLLFGRKKGVNTIVALIFTCMAVFWVYIPAILKGYNIYLWSILTCVFIGINTLLIVQGVTKKSFVAMIGTLSGTAISGILTIIMSKVLSLTGMLEEESLYLHFLNEDKPINLKAIIFGSIIVGAIGAIMDVAIDIASSLNEVAKAMERPSKEKIVRSGFEIGRDIIGTMSNTLVLAYIGSSLSCTLLTITYSGTLTYLMNKEVIVVEILQALVGSLGIFATIPLTTYISADFYISHTKKKTKSNSKHFKELLKENPFADSLDEKSDVWNS